MSQDALFELLARSSVLVPWVPVLVLVPPLLLAALLIAPRGSARVAAVAPLAALPALLAALAAPATEIVLPGLLLGSSLTIDPISRPFLAVFALLWLAAGWLAGEQLQARGRMLLFLLAMTGTFALAIAGDLVVFLLASTVVGYAVYGLAAGQRGAGALISLLVLSDLLLFELLLLLVKDGAGLSLTGDVPSGAIAGSAALLALMVVGFGAKAALLGFHYWLPAILSAPAKYLGPILIGFVLGAGLFPWLRLLPPMSPTGIAVPEAVAWTIVAAIGVAALLGLLQRDRHASIGYALSVLTAFWLLLLTGPVPAAAVQTPGAAAAVAMCQSALAAATLLTLPARYSRRWKALIWAGNGFAVLLLVDAVLALGAIFGLGQRPAIDLTACAFVGLALGRLLWHPFFAVALSRGRLISAVPEPAASPLVVLFLAAATALWAATETGTMSLAVEPMAAAALLSATAVSLLVMPTLSHLPRLPPDDIAAPVGGWLGALWSVSRSGLERHLTRRRDVLQAGVTGFWPERTLRRINRSGENQLRRWAVAMILLVSLILLIGAFGCCA